MLRGGAAPPAGLARPRDAFADPAPPSSQGKAAEAPGGASGGRHGGAARRKALACAAGVRGARAPAPKLRSSHTQRRQDFGVGPGGARAVPRAPPPPPPPPPRVSARSRGKPRLASSLVVIMWFGWSVQTVQPGGQRADEPLAPPRQGGALRCRLLLPRKVLGEAPPSSPARPSPSLAPLLAAPPPPRGAAGSPGGLCVCICACARAPGRVRLCVSVTGAVRLAALGEERAPEREREATAAAAAAASSASSSSLLSMLPSRRVPRERRRPLGAARAEQQQREEAAKQQQQQTKEDDGGDEATAERATATAASGAAARGPARAA